MIFTNKLNLHEPAACGSDALHTVKLCSFISEHAKPRRSQTSQRGCRSTITYLSSKAASIDTPVRRSGSFMKEPRPDSQE